MEERVGIDVPEASRVRAGALPRPAPGSWWGPRVLPAWAALLAILFSPCWFPGGQAEAEDDGILYVAKNALYGGATGLLLGGVTALVVDKDNRDDALRWGITIGTFAGFAYGIYRVTRDDDDFFKIKDPMPKDGEPLYRMSTGAYGAFRLQGADSPPTAWRTVARLSGSDG